MSSDSATGLKAVCGSFIGLSVLSTGLRVYARKHTSAPILLDDGAILIAVVAFIGAAACILRMVDMRALGYSSKDMSLAETAAAIQQSEQLTIAWGVLCIICLAFVKLSILFFYRRAFDTTRKGAFHWLTVITISVVIAWLVTFEFLVGFQCGTHLSALWDGTYKRFCTISFPYLYGLAISDFLLDVWILLLPAREIARLHASPAKKFNIGGIFLLAFVGLGDSIARMVEYINIELGGTGGLFSSDHEKSLSQSFYLAMLEAGMSVVAANLPSIWLLFSTATPESVMRSIRGAFSLQSWHGSGGRNPNTDAAAEAGSVAMPARNSITKLHTPSRVSDVDIAVSEHHAA